MKWMCGRINACIAPRRFCLDTFGGIMWASSANSAFPFSFLEILSTLLLVTIVGTRGVMTCMFGSVCSQQLQVGFISRSVQCSSALLVLVNGSASFKGSKQLDFSFGSKAVT